VPTITFTDNTPVSRCLSSTNANYALLQAQATGTISAATQYIGQKFLAGTYSIWRRAALFDTSTLAALGPITINSATLQLYCIGSDLASADFDLTITRDATQVAPHNPVVKEDYEITQYTGGSGGAKTASTFVNAVYNNIAMTSTWVINDGVSFTKVFLASSRDIAAIAPTKGEWLTIGLGTDDQCPMRLVVDYKLGGGGGNGGARGCALSYSEIQKLDEEYRKFLESQNRPILISSGYIERVPLSRGYVENIMKKKRKKKSEWKRVKYTDVR
jgi:hypothetical protein